MKNWLENALLTIVLVVGIALLIDYGFVDSIRALSHVDFFFILVSFAMFLVFTTLRVLPWSVAIRRLHLKMNFIYKVLMTYYFWGISGLLSVFGQIFSLRDLERFQRNAKFLSGSIFLSTNLIGTLALSIIMLVCAVLLSKYVAYAVLFVLAFYIFSSILGIDFVNNLLLSATKGRKDRISKSLKRYFVSMKKYRGMFSQKYILLMVLAFLPTLLAEGSLVYFILLAENQHIALVTALFIFSFSDLAGIMSFSPSGLGVMDTLMIVLLLAAGIPGVLTLSTVLLFRLFQLFLPALEGYLSIPFIKSKRFY